METWDAIRARRNVRVYTDRPIAEADLERILEAGRRAPSASNRQPWDFVVTTDRGQLEALATVWRGARHLLGAAAAIVLTLKEPEEERYRLMDQYDLGQATMAMELAAVDLGIGSGHSAIGDQDRVPADPLDPGRADLRLHAGARVPRRPRPDPDPQPEPSPLRRRGPPRRLVAGRRRPDPLLTGRLFGHRFDLGHLGRRQDPLARGGVRAHLLGLGRPGDHRADERLGGQPRDGELEHAVPVVLRPAAERVDDVEVLVGEAPRARSPQRCRRVPSGGDSPRVYLPERRPLASGKYGR